MIQWWCCSINTYIIYVYCIRMWHVCALGWMAPCLSYDVPTRCPSYFWWIMMIQTARIWSDPTATPWEPGMNKVSMEVGKSDQYKSMPSKVSIVGPVHTLHQRHVTTLPHIHFGPSFDPSSHSTDGYSQTCMYLENVELYTIVYPKNLHFFCWFLYVFYSFYMFTWFRPFFHCSTSTASGVDSVPRIFSSWEVNTWWRDYALWLDLISPRGSPWSLPQTSRPLEWRQCQNLRGRPEKIATSLKFVRYINVVPSFYDIVQSSLASTFGAPLEGQMRFHLPMLPSEMLMHWCKCPVTRRWSNTTGRWPRSGTSRWKRWKLTNVLKALMNPQRVERDCLGGKKCALTFIYQSNQSMSINQSNLLYPSIHPSRSIITDS